jgi:hypothetical protein
VLKGEKKRPRFKPSQLDKKAGREEGALGEGKRPGSEKRSKTASLVIRNRLRTATGEPIHAFVAGQAPPVKPGDPAGGIRPFDNTGNSEIYHSDTRLIEPVVFLEEGVTRFDITVDQPSPVTRGRPPARCGAMWTAGVDPSAPYRSPNLRRAKAPSPGSRAQAWDRWR